MAKTILIVQRTLATPSTVSPTEDSDISAS